jgi:N-hydroxyarylamine O-acetyltransferase
MGMTLPLARGRAWYTSNSRILILIFPSSKVQNQPIDLTRIGRNAFMTINLDAYFARIGYTGPRTATLETLQALHALHPNAIPFENLSVLLGEEVLIDLDASQNKLVGAGRGGYCFEHNTVFKAVLDALGFKTRPLGARVVWANSVPPARLHTLTLVEIDQVRWIADVGFGTLTLTAPLRLDVRDAQQTPHERFRIDAIDEGGFLLLAELGDKWAPVYQFDLVPQLGADNVLGNFYVNFHPDSLFVNNLLASRAVRGTRYSLFNGEFSTYTPEPTHSQLKDVGELRAVLRDSFGISLPDGAEELDDALARCLARPGRRVQA